jgi:hypothetical protein
MSSCKAKDRPQCIRVAKIFIQRKTRCDTGLPRCGPCERTNSVCEYFDQSKGAKIPRHYVVHLQHKVSQLESQLESIDKEDYEPDAEDIVRPGAAVRIQEHDESKFLGPSSGIAITRLVMQLAKRFTESESISDIVDRDKQQEIKESFAQEESKPDSKVYPIISNIAAPDLPARDVTDQLVRLFNAKGIFLPCVYILKFCLMRNSHGHVPFLTNECQDDSMLLFNWSLFSTYSYSNSRVLCHRTCNSAGSSAWSMRRENH